MKRWVISAFFTFLLTASMSVGQNAVSLDSVSGFMSPNKVPVGKPVTYTLRFTTDMPGNFVFGFFNAFDWYSPDGATWTPLTYSWADNAAAVALRDEWGLAVFFVSSTNNNGMGHDTVFATPSDYNTPGTGFTSFDAQLLHITTPKFTVADTGKTVCLDSCTNFPPSFLWAFAGIDGDGIDTTYFPTFGTGPYAANYTAGMGYCFTLAPPPYICGDINNNGTVTVADMVYLIQYFFNSGPAIPAPIERANVNCLGDPTRPTIADNTYLVSYLFNNGPVPCANCL